MIEYDKFLSSKRIVDPPTGFDPTEEINPQLFPFQRDIVRWALRRGRAAIFADCGLGKTPMQLEWARHVPGRVLILAPLAVTEQTKREGEKFGIEVQVARRQEDATGKIVATNYEMLDRFDPSLFAGVVLDESSILKSYMGKTKRRLLEAFAHTPFRLACTATPAPNDLMELGNHAQFLGAMDSNEMLARWFINDSMHAGNYRLKGHGARDFWKWVASWAVAMMKPSDLGDYDDQGFVLPDLRVRHATVNGPPPEGTLFHLGDSLSATEIHTAKRASAKDRAAEVAVFVREDPGQCLIWCDTNYEADALVQAIGECVEVRGNDSAQKKAQALIAFAQGEFRVLVTKPLVAGFGMNFQGCHRVAFVGLSYSFEALYQALRRVWRFGQKVSVDAIIVEAQSEIGIRSTVERKMEDQAQMQKEMVSAMSGFQRTDGKELTDAPNPESRSGKDWVAWHGDCVETLRRQVGYESVDYSIFSPPFASLYIYSDSIADMGNSEDQEEFFAHFGYLVGELLRVTAPGRLCSVHCKDLPAYMGRDGAAGLIDFPGRTIRAFEAGGWQYHSRVTIWKSPVTEMQRTKNHGLLHKQLCKDSSASRQGMADYLLTFRKWTGGEFERPVNGPSKDVRFVSYVGDEGPPLSSNPGSKDYSIQVWQRYASPVWFDVQQQRVLQGSRNATREEDERHICPLQLDVIERAVALWTNPRDLVLSPFMGIGSEGVVSIEQGRRFVGVELKRSYWTQACANLSNAKRMAADLFDPPDQSADATNCTSDHGTIERGESGDVMSDTSHRVP